MDIHTHNLNISRCISIKIKKEGSWRMPLESLKPLKPLETITTAENNETSFDFTKWMDMAKLFSELVEDEPSPITTAPLSSTPVVTHFDQTLASPQINMLKAIIPYFEVPQQRFLGIFIKSLELKKVLDLYPASQLSSLENPFPRNSDWKVGILQSIRPHCPKEKQKILDMMLNLFQMQNMIEKTQLFQKTFTPPETITPILNENNPSLLSEQNQDMFFKLLEMFSSLSSPMNASKQNSYTNNEKQ